MTQTQACTNLFGLGYLAWTELGQGYKNLTLGMMGTGLGADDWVLIVGGREFIDYDEARAAIRFMGAVLRDEQ